MENKKRPKDFTVCILNQANSLSNAVNGKVLEINGRECMPLCVLVWCVCLSVCLCGVCVSVARPQAPKFNFGSLDHRNTSKQESL